MKTIKKPLAAVAALIASIVAAFGQYTVLVDDSSNIIFPTNLASIPAAGLTGTAPTNVLPGALATLSTWNGGGALTNLAGPSVTVITNIGTTAYSIPAWARRIDIFGVTGGGAGASGRRGAAGTVRSGGSGGSGGAVIFKEIPNVATLWTNKLLVTIPALLTGGPAVTTDDSNGTNGAAQAVLTVHVGASATSNLLVHVLTGASGTGGDSDGSVGGSTGTGLFPGGAGGASSTTGLLGADGATVFAGGAATGGGAGGGITTGDVTSAGGGGGIQRYPWFTLQNAGGAAGAAGTSTSSAFPTLSEHYLWGWPGAGGGGSQTNAVAGAGANGYGWGAGGGGGGASLNGYASGKGGDGGPSVVVITAY